MNEKIFFVQTFFYHQCKIELLEFVKKITIFNQVF